MRLGILFIVGLTALVAGATTYAKMAKSKCPTGEAAGFIAIDPQPSYLVGTLPGIFTTDARYFSRRYNCTGGSAAARRVGLGLYEVRFPGLSGRAAVVSATSEEGVTASAVLVDDGVYRVALRGPLVGNDVATRRDVPFVVVVY